MPRWVDLHLHSTCSDGRFPPAEVIRQAAVAGLSAVALTDHDNVDGIDQALAAGAVLGVEVLPAVELSVQWETWEDIHILGYGIDHHQPALTAALAEFRAFRGGRNERIVANINARLQEEGRAPIDFAEVRARAAGTPGRPHIAQVLMERGYVAGQEQAFHQYLIPCNEPKRFFPLQDAIGLLHGAGGVAVLAHPSYISDQRAELLQLFDAFAALGLDGIEAYNNRATNDDIDWLISQARRRRLIVTGGSDYHGIPGTEIVIGGGRGNLRIPYSCVEEIRSALKQGCRPN
jgi:hypothetical protein